MTATDAIHDRRRNALSALTGEFINPHQELGFRAGIRPVWLTRARTIILVGLAAHLITSFIDYVLLGLTPAFYALLGARLVVTAQGLAFLWIVSRNHSTRVWDFGLLLTLVLLVSAFLTMVALRPDGPRITAPAAILVLCVFYMVPMTRLWVAASSALYLSLGMAVVGHAVSAASDPPLIVIGIQLFTANLIGYFVCLRMHKDARMAWLNQQSLERRERHQRLLAHLSSNFLDLRADQFDNGVRQTFKSLCEYTGSDRAYLMEFDTVRQTGSMTHEWCAEGVPATRPTMQNIPSALVPWASLKMQRGEIVQADDVRNLPPEAAVERDLSLAQGVKSFLCVPLTHDGQLLGMIGLDSVRRQCAWSPETVELLRFVGQAMFNMLHRARAEEGLRDREAQFQTLASLSPVGIFQTDADGYCLYANERWVQLSGLSREMALGNRWRRALHPDDAERVIAAWSDAVARKTEFADEYRFRRPDGSVVWLQGRARPQFDADGHVLGFVGAIDDITERKQAHLEIKQRARLDEFVSALTVKFLQADKMDTDSVIQRALADVGEFADADRCGYFFIDTDKGSMSCLHKWLRPDVDAQDLGLQNLLITDYGWVMSRILRGEVVNIPRADSVPVGAPVLREKLEANRVRSLRLVPILSTGQVIGFVSLTAVRSEMDWSADITLVMRIAGEMILNSLQRQDAQQSQQSHIRDLEAVNLELERRNTELQRLAYVTTHDLQEPLRVISGFSTMLGQNYRGRLDAQADEYIAFVTEASDRLHKLINDLLTYTRVDHQVRAPAQCDLNEITQVVLDNLDDTARQLKARIEYDPLPTVVAEPMLLIQLMQHLVVNALRFHGDAPPVIRVSAERTETEWVISVADNGIGIAPEHAKRVFELFQRLNPSDRHPGTGIGLPVCRRIVERHGGRIWVEPNAPRGSVFRWTLPQALSAAAGQSDASRHAA